MSFDLDTALDGLCAEHAAGVAAAMPRDHGEAMRALFETLTHDLPEVGEPDVPARQVAASRVACRVLPDRARLVLTGACEEQREAKTLVGLARNTEALIARAKEADAS